MAKRKATSRKIKKTGQSRLARSKKRVRKASVPAPKADLLKPGQAAPDFRLESDSGKELSLKDLRGRTVVLYFYPKDMTSGCTREACDFQASLPRFESKGVAVVGISRDSVDLHRRFKEKYGLRFPLLSDPDARMLKSYKVWKEKSMYGRKFMGIERTTVVIGPDGVVRHVFPKVKVNGHVEEVLSSL